MRALNEQSTKPPASTASAPQSQAAKPSTSTSQDSRAAYYDWLKDSRQKYYADKQSYYDKKLEFHKQQNKERAERFKQTSKDRSERLRLQMQQAKDRARQYRGGFSMGGERVSERDTDPTATAKTIGNAASVVGRLAGLGVRSAVDKMRKNAEARREGERKAGEKDAEIKAAMKQKRLPSGGSSRFEKTDKTRVSQPGTSRPSEPIPGTDVPGDFGRRARKDPNFKKRLIQDRMPKMEEYEYSCWREEFLYELGDMRQQSKNKKNLGKDPVVDVMKGKNKIILNPTVSEATETPQDKFDRLVAAASKLTGSAKIKMLKYAASKHPKMNEEVMCDERASREPGKGTAEMVRDRMSRMFTNTPDSYSPMKISTLKAMAMKRSRDK